MCTNTFSNNKLYLCVTDNSDESSECEEIDADQVIIHDSTPKTSVIQRCIR